MAYKFENLRVWQAAIEFTDDVYLVSGEFPKEEIFGLTSQIRRAANSIALNIAEGATGNSNPEFKRFLTMSSRSCAERSVVFASWQKEKIYSTGYVLRCL